MSNSLAKNLFIVTSTSGACKTTLINNILKFAETNNEKVFMSISHTTRTARDGEIDGIDYLFINESEFKSNVEQGIYVEHALVHRNLYGPPRIARCNRNFKRLSRCSKYFHISTFSQRIK